jgi:SnoaL-like domain
MRFCAVLLLAACAHTSRGPGAEQFVAGALDDFHDAAARADEDRYFAHFAPGGVFLGTDATERWEVPAFRAYAHPHFARGKAWTFRAARRSVTVRGDMAWFDEDLETQNLGPARGSGVLSLHDGKWLIDQYVLSITVPNDRFRAVRDLLAAP